MPEHLAGVPCVSGDKTAGSTWPGERFGRRSFQPTDNVLQLGEPVDGKFLFGRAPLSGRRELRPFKRSCLAANGAQISLRDRPRAASSNPGR